MCVCVGEMFRAHWLVVLLLIESLAVGQKKVSRKRDLDWSKDKCSQKLQSLKMPTLFHPQSCGQYVVDLMFFFVQQIAHGSFAFLAKKTSLFGAVLLIAGVKRAFLGAPKPGRMEPKPSSGAGGADGHLGGYAWLWLLLKTPTPNPQNKKSPFSRKKTKQKHFITINAPHQHHFHRRHMASTSSLLFGKASASRRWKLRRLVAGVSGLAPKCRSLMPQ